MMGKIVIVTGANSGIGKATAAAIADKGAKVILACRCRERGEAALCDLKSKPGRDLELMHLDLADLNSVRTFADAFTQHYEHLDALVNNAGYLGRRTETKQGFESNFGVNYLGHFLLTLLLLPLLEKSAQGRVVMMSSVAHAWGDVHFDDMNLNHGYNRFVAYGQSKLCNLLFTRILSEKLKNRGSRVTVNAVHPGIVATNIVVNRKNNMFRLVARIMRLFFASCEKGAKTSVFLACDPSLANVSGEYFYHCHIEPTSAASKNMENANRLYKLSLDFAGLPGDPLK